MAAEEFLLENLSLLGEEAVAGALVALDGYAAMIAGVASFASLTSEDRSLVLRALAEAEVQDLRDLFHRYVAFVSPATNLVTGDTNGYADVFVRDTAAGTPTRVSVSTTGAQDNGASSASVQSRDGRYAVFVSSATTWCRTIPTGWPTCSSPEGRKEDS